MEWREEEEEKEEKEKEEEEDAHLSASHSLPQKNQSF